MPAPIARAGALTFTPLARVGVPVPFTYESVSMLFQGWAPTDESRVRDEFCHGLVGNFDAYGPGFG